MGRQHAARTFSRRTTDRVGPTEPEHPARPLLGAPRIGAVALLRLFASAREAAGTDRAEIPGATAREILEAAGSRFGDQFRAVLAISQVWVNGEPVELDDPVTDTDEVAVLPPVSGGA